MKTKLILVEGLPGSGKTTTAERTYEFLKSHNIPVELYSEGNLDHPADYDGVACFSKQEFNNLLNTFPHFKELLAQNAQMQKHDIFIPYQKIRVEQKVDLPDVLMDKFYSKDIYELPLKDHIRLITGKWKNFAKLAVSSPKTYIFECCYIQNPVTTAFVKHNASVEVALNYVQGLTEAIKDLKPLLIYVDQNDISFTFKKTLAERSKGWAEFFINYYTGQGFGLEHGLKSVEGTIQVLKHRSSIEKEIIGHLDIEKMVLDNSNYYTGQGFGLEHGLKSVEGTIQVLKHRSNIEKEIIGHLDIKKMVLDNSNYYTGQGFGLEHGLKSVEGTIQVLKHRSSIEKEIIGHLDIEKMVLDNSNYDQMSFQLNQENLLAKKLIE